MLLCAQFSCSIFLLYGQIHPSCPFCCLKDHFLLYFFLDFMVASAVPALNRESILVCVRYCFGLGVLGGERSTGNQTQNLTLARQARCSQAVSRSLPGFLHRTPGPRLDPKAEGQGCRPQAGSLFWRPLMSISGITPAAAWQGRGGTSDDSTKIWGPLGIPVPCSSPEAQL